MKNETPQPHLGDKPPKLENNYNHVHIELGSNHKPSPIKKSIFYNKNPTSLCEQVVNM